MKQESLVWNRKYRNHSLQWTDAEDSAWLFLGLSSSGDLERSLMGVYFNTINSGMVNFSASCTFVSGLC